MKRAKSAVLNDVIQEKVSIEQAREVYGVVIDPEKLEIDEGATAELRARWGASEK